MFALLKNLIGLNSALATKIRGDQLYDEASAFAKAGEHANALRLMKESSDCGNQHATVQVAMMLLKGLGTTPNWLGASEYLQLAIDRGVANVHLNLGMVFGIGGYGLKRQLDKAELHLKQAAAVDNDPAADQMLAMLRKKQGVFGGKEVARPQIPWR